MVPLKWGRVVCEVNAVPLSLTVKLRVFLCSSSIYRLVKEVFKPVSGNNTKGAVMLYKGPELKLCIEIEAP